MGKTILFVCLVVLFATSCEKEQKPTGQPRTVGFKIETTQRDPEWASAYEVISRRTGEVIVSRKALDYDPVGFKFVATESFDYYSREVVEFKFYRENGFSQFQNITVQNTPIKGYESSPRDEKKGWLKFYHEIR